MAFARKKNQTYIIVEQSKLHTHTKKKKGRQLWANINIVGSYFNFIKHPLNYTYRKVNLNVLLTMLKARYLNVKQVHLLLPIMLK